MQFFNTVALASSLISAVNAIAAPAPSPTKCNADNCLRQVRASAFPTRSGTADCQAFQTVTSTVVTTTTVAAAAAAAGKVKRAVVDPNIMITQLAKRAAPAIPTYASGCSNSAQYASACSCAGVTASTKTVTSTVTSTSTPAAACPTGTYAIQQQGSADGNMNYGVLAEDTYISGNSFWVDFTQTVDLAGASKFDFVADSANPTLCRLRSVTISSAISLVTDPNGRFNPAHLFRISDPAVVSASRFRMSPVYCVKGAANKLQCTAVDSAGVAAPENTLYNDIGFLRIGTADQATSQYYILVTA
ncbi:hypothetical protein CGRA01v4_10757 [Colletotrichum graminicola]|uniref:Uncharacterized protein n=1 Tax=Colletotrichum graminicola (strain M1.001 / M2 / FGSC 10212) TaxID=645133 RepID=E3QSM4_COLGM|nr:uncharacterized protein GLRG_09006 [Colletotrichum graminicola M1.001]EFQ33862.1 hypothetical protein GLRG_09006 [Colletotrichum graminicola M1.001]WDK19470.1 hypothetical protein CGRA01v4_10757 [Colletotrichum graminicola]